MMPRFWTSAALAMAFVCVHAVQVMAHDDNTRRVIALGGSVTEIVVALGAGEQLVARDSTSTFPHTIKALPDVGYLRALSPEGVLALNPTLILAEADAGPVEAVDVLRAAGVPFVTMPDDPTPEGVAAKVMAVADAMGLQAEGATLAARITADLAAVTAEAAKVTQPKRVLFILSAQDGRIMAGGDGTAAAGMIALAGGINAATGFDGYKQMTDEAVLTAAPDVILMMDRAGDHAASTADLLALPALASSPAADGDHVIRMDGLLLLGFGPRTAEAARTLHAALYPQEG
jgi:iron complex transport system substrate-binding protein